MASWNPWHGCRKISAGCQNCYVYRGDCARGLDASDVHKLTGYESPLAKTRDGSYKIPSGETVWTCFTSDFLLEEADPWRPYAWEMMHIRSDLNFFFITKRIHRLEQCLPPDWGEGYPNVSVSCTVEDQDRADFRLPIFINAPIKHKYLACEPLLEPVDLSKWLCRDIIQLVAGGESGAAARPCHYDWILDLRRQCIEANVPFHFKQTGSYFVRDGKEYKIPRKLQHSQARQAGINIPGPGNGICLH